MARVIDTSTIMGGVNKNTAVNSTSTMDKINQAINNLVSNTQNGKTPTAIPTPPKAESVMSNAVQNGTVMGNGGTYNAGYGTSGGANSSVNPSNKVDSVMSNAVPNGTVMGNGGIYNAGYGTSGGVNSSVNPSNKNTSTTNKTTTSTTKKPTTSNVVNTYTPSYEEEVGEEYISNPGNYAGGGNTQSQSSIFDTINEWYEAQKQAAINKIQHAMDEAIADYQKSIDGLDENYQPLRNQSEVERFKSERALKEQLANGGNTYSGLGRQEALNLQNAYSNNITDINNQQQNELEELLRAIQNVKAEGEYQKANAGLTYDANQLQSMINQANLDREYEWNKYLQQYQEKQDTLAYDWQKYLQDYKEKTNTIKGITGNNSSSSVTKHTATQAKNWLNNSLTTGDVYDSFDEDLDTYYNNYGSYPTDEMMDAFIEQVNEHPGGNYSGSNYLSSNYAEALLFAWHKSGRLNDAQAAILGAIYNIDIDL